jgi:hypothetical protein
MKKSFAIKCKKNTTKIQTRINRKNELKWIEIPIKAALIKGDLIAGKS